MNAFTTSSAEPLAHEASIEALMRAVIEDRPDLVDTLLLALNPQLAAELYLAVDDFSLITDAFRPPEPDRTVR